MGIKWFWGPPTNPGHMRFHTGTLLSKPGGQRFEHRQYTLHEITGLFGLQIGKSFVGRVQLGQWGAETQSGPKEAARAKTGAGE